MQTIYRVLVVFLLCTLFYSCQEDKTELKPVDTGLFSRGLDLAWSPDGEQLAVISGDSLYTLNRNGTNRHLIATGAYSKPSWSSSGDILFQGFSMGFSIRKVKMDGSSDQMLIGPDYRPQQPEWSSAQDKISFVGTDPNGDFFIYVMNSDGTGLHKLLASGPLVSIFQVPCWTPDDSAMLFITGFDNEHDLYLIKSNDSYVHRLQIPDQWEEYASFNRTGEKIIFSSAGNIYEMNIDGSNLVNLTGSNGQNMSPVLSPDGSRIAFYSYRNNEDGLYVMKADGSNQQRLAGPGVAQNGFKWSPDGKEIAYVASRMDSNDLYFLGIYIVSVPD